MVLAPAVVTVPHHSSCPCWVSMVGPPFDLCQVVTPPPLTVETVKGVPPGNFSSTARARTLPMAAGETETVSVVVSAGKSSVSVWSVPTAVIVDPGVVYVKWSADEMALVPPPVVTVTSTVPAAWAGEVATIWVALFVPITATVAPKCTLVADVRFVPVIVTDVPPAVVPPVGLTLVTVGAAGLAVK